jgi:hypothetical protein
MSLKLQEISSDSSRTGRIHPKINTPVLIVLFICVCMLVFIVYTVLNRPINESNDKQPVFSKSIDTFIDYAQRFVLVFLIFLFFGTVFYMYSKKF